MAKEKRSFFERLTGSVRIDSDRDEEREEISLRVNNGIKDGKAPAANSSAGLNNNSFNAVTAAAVNATGGKKLYREEVPSDPWAEEEEKEGQLTVDVYQTTDSIVIKTMVAGVRPEDLDIAITRDLVTIKGRREEERGIREEDYFIRELYWGAFSRTITLPEEIDVEEAEAMEKHGLLIIKLPKIDKGRQTKLRVKTIA